MARRSDHTREELKEEILKASRKIIEKSGFAGLTARKIAKDIGYSPGSIYNVFKSMDDLALTLNGQTLDELYLILADPKCDSPRKTVVNNMKYMCSQYRKFAQNQHQQWLMLFTHTMPKGKKVPKWYQDKVGMLFMPLEELLIPFYTERQVAKRKMGARVLWASVHGICFLEETGKIPLIADKAKAPDLTGYLIDNFISGIDS